jgi:hypothetical protein
MAYPALVDPPWVATNGSMETARTQHAVVRLPSGNVLVTGGFGTGGLILDSAELFDPQTGTWASTSPMPQVEESPFSDIPRIGRVTHTMNLLADSDCRERSSAERTELPRVREWAAVAKRRRRHGGNRQVGRWLSPAGMSGRARALAFASSLWVLGRRA